MKISQTRQTLLSYLIFPRVRFSVSAESGRHPAQCIWCPSARSALRRRPRRRPPPRTRRRRSTRVCAPASSGRRSRRRLGISSPPRHHSPSSPVGNHVGEGGLWHLGDARRSQRVDLDGGGRARGAVAGRRQPPSTSRCRLSKAGGIIGCCSQAAADKDINNIPAQSVVARAAAGDAINPRHRCTCVLPLPTRLHPRPPAPAPSSALRLIAACVAQCRPTRRWPEHDCEASVWAGGAFDSARGCLSLPFATPATTVELHAVHSSSGGASWSTRVYSPRRLSSCAGCLSNRFCSVLLCPVLALSLRQEGHRRRRRSGGPIVTKTRK